MKSSTSTHNITINSFLVSIFLLFTLVPWLGYIPLGIFKITLMPILFLISVQVFFLTTKSNWILSGLLYGFLFGLSSLIQAVLYPSATSFILINPLFSVVPRVLMGLMTGLVAFCFNSSNMMKPYFKKIMLAFIATTFNTFFVLSFIYLLGPVTYKNLNLDSIFKIFSWMILVTNYLPELILSALIFPPVALALIRIY